MKHIAILTLIFLSIFSNSATAQPKPKQKQPAQSEMDKAMEDAMKGMSEEEKAEMKKMMNGVMPMLADKSARMADYPDFTSNRELVSKKDAVRIASIPKKRITQADISSYASTLYAKIMVKGDATEIALIKSILPKTPKAIDLSNASVVCMMQGHPQAAMALSMKAVQASPANVNFQNNMAALLSQYGYPEQAIPVLQKLKNDFPNNSTVLNNLGLAWFNLGELDSAKLFTGLAIRVNPYHPEAKVCGGIIEEIKGDPIKATKDYTEAIENSADPMIDKILKNKTGDKGFEKIDFEKLKRSITIYEYFPKDWIKIPKLSDNVSGYEQDMSIKNGYDKMFEQLEQKLDVLKEAAAQETNALMNKGEDEFIKEMAAESINGINKMSLTAVTVIKILSLYIARETMGNSQKAIDMQTKISAKRAEMTKSGKDDKCPDYDRKNNEFLAYANPLIREFHAERIEKFRNWLNAFCTWIWYITGNPKNTVMLQCIGWTEGIADYYQSAIDDQEAIAKTCVSQNNDRSTPVALPEIPNFSCPTLVKIPVGADWQELSNAAKNFDVNSLGIKSNPANPVPNHTLAFGGDHTFIAQPGKAPFVKTANGSTAPGMINSADDELTPLSKIPLEELTPLPKLPKDDDLTPLPKIPLDDLTPLPDLRKSKLAKELLKKMMSSDCKNVKNSKDILKQELDRMMKGVKELDAYENVIEQIKKLEAEIEQKEVDGQKKEHLKKQMEKMQQETDKMDKYEQIQQSKKEIEKIMKEMDAMDDKKIMKDKFNRILQSIEEMENTPAGLKDIQQDGLQPSISSGVQVPGTITPVKGIFN